MNESESERVDGAGWISDESDFYGDARVQARFEKKARKGLKRGHDEAFAVVNARNAKRIKREPVSEVKDVLAAHADTGPKSEYKIKNEIDMLHPDFAVLETSPLSRKDTQGNVLSFLKARPQVAAMAQDYTLRLQQGNSLPQRQQSANEMENTFNVSHSLSTPTTREPDNDPNEMLDNSRSFKGQPDTRQSDEIVLNFLRRAPVEEPATADLGPWLWVHAPRISRRQYEHAKRTDVNAFEAGGTDLLEAFTVQKSKIAAANPAKVPATITRYTRPYLETLEDSLIDLAVATATTCGKWLLFPAVADLPRTWRLIAEATAAGKLGPTSKVATYDYTAPPDKERVICVYTYDFTDKKDVRRVLDELVELGLCRGDMPRGIFYKCDAWTYLNLMSDNDYGIKATLYSSRDMLADDGETAFQKGGNVKMPVGIMARFTRRAV